MTQDEILDQIAETLKARGIRMNIEACGCCGSPRVSVEIDGVLLLDDGEEANLYMISDEKAPT